MGGPAPVVVSSPRRVQQCADGAKWKGITMFGIMLIVLAAVITYKAAEMSERSGGLWAAICVLITLVWGYFLPFGFAAGLFGSLLIMLVCNVVSDPRK